LILRSRIIRVGNALALDGCDAPQTPAPTRNGVRRT